MRQIVDGFGNLGRDVSFVHGKGARTGALLTRIAGVALPVVGNRYIEPRAPFLANQAQLALGNGCQVLLNSQRLTTLRASHERIGGRCAASNGSRYGAGNTIDTRQRCRVGKELVRACGRFVKPAGGCRRAIGQRCGKDGWGACAGISIGGLREPQLGSLRSAGDRNGVVIGASQSQVTRAITIEKCLPVIRENVQRLVVKQLQLPVVVATHLHTVELITAPRSTTKGGNIAGRIGLVGFDRKVIQVRAVLQILVFAKRNIPGVSIAPQHSGLDTSAVFPAALGFVTGVGCIIKRYAVKLSGR